MSHKYEIRKLIKDSSIQELQVMLQKLSTERLKTTNRMVGMEGSSKHVRNYPSKPGEWKYRNIKQLNKDIARIKNELHMRLLR